MAEYILKTFILLMLFLCITLVYLLVTSLINEDIKQTIEEQKIRNTRLEIIEEISSWELFVPAPPNDTIECVQAIIDDALCYNFEFKVDNGKIYFRERR